MFPGTHLTQSRRRRGYGVSIPAIATGAFQALTSTLLQPIIVLSMFAFLLGGTNVQIASFSVALLLGWTLAPILTSIVRGFTIRTDRILLSVSIIRLLAMLILGFEAIRIRSLAPSRLLGLLIGLFIIYQLTTAMISSLTSDAIVRGTRGPATRAVFRKRRLFGMAASIVASAIVWRVFDSAIPTERAIQQVILMAVLAATAATWFSLQASVGNSVAPRIPIGKSIQGAAGTFRVAAFRRFAAYKILLAGAAAVDPFLIIFGIREAGLDVSYLGLALLALVSGQVIGALLWPRWIAASGPRIPFQLAALLRLAFLLWIIAIPALSRSSLYTDRFDDTTPMVQTFAIGFVLLGLAMSAGTAANQRYLMDLSSSESLSAAEVAMNGLMTICGLGPLIVAWLLATYDLDHVLWGSTVCAAAALFASGVLVESTAYVRKPVGLWRTVRRAENRV